MRWAAFAESAPELAALGRAGFGEQNLCLIGTLRADGWPRLSANEVYVVDGELLLGMMRDSRKSKDLERDPRITVMTPQCDREAKRGDFKAYGRAIPVTDAKNTWSTSHAASPARASASDTARSPSSTAQRM